MRFKNKTKKYIQYKSIYISLILNEYVHGVNNEVILWLRFFFLFYYLLKCLLELWSLLVSAFFRLPVGNFRGQKYWLLWTSEVASFPCEKAKINYQRTTTRLLSTDPQTMNHELTELRKALKAKQAENFQLSRTRKELSKPCKGC